MDEFHTPIKKQAEIVKAWNFLPYALALLVFSFILGICYLRYDTISTNVTTTIAKQLNLKVKHIYLSGIENSNIENISKAINITKGEPLFSATPKNIRENLETLPWVRLAQVQRIFPDTITINIFEHKAIATIVFNGQRWALNSKGELIDIVGDKYNHLLELSGENSKDKAAVFFSLFSNWSDLLYLLKQAEFVGNRRWNIYLKNGTIIMLPEENVRYALEVLKVLDSEQRVLNKTKIRIDLRNVEKHIIIDEKSNIL